MIEILMQDLRFAARGMRRSPGYAAVVALSLALGIGANTAIFSLIDAVLLQMLPVRNPEQLVVVGNPARVGGVSSGEPRTDIFSYPFYQRLRESNAVFSDMYASGRAERLNVVAAGERSATGAKDENPRGRFVTGNYFSVLGVNALLGRTFGAEDDRESATPTAVISHAYWSRRFARDPSVVGQKITVNGTAFNIVGVAPSEFFGDIVGTPTDIWFPVHLQPLANPGRNYLRKTSVSWLLLMGRLKPGVSEAKARAAINTLGLPILIEYAGKDVPPDFRQRKIEVSSGAKGFSRLRAEFSVPLFILMAVVGLVLLISCANVANLQLARAVARGREISVRLAVGASRSRLVRLLVTESLLLAAVGGGIGLLFALWTSELFLKLVANGSPLPLEIGLNGTVLLFTAAVSIGSGLLFGLTPALRVTRPDLVADLKDARSAQAHGFSRGFGKSLIAAQVALSLVVLIGAGLFIRTLQNLENVDVGYRTGNLLLVELDPQASGYKDPQINRLTRELLQRLAATPGVQAVSVSENGLFSGTESEDAVDVEGYTAQSQSDRRNRSDRVGPNFEVTGTRIISGRGIGPQDDEGAPKVAVINEAMARFYFPKTNPIGAHLFSGDGADRVSYTIVGVSRDVKQNHLRDAAPRRFYMSYLQHADPITAVNLEVRTRLRPAATVDSVRRAIKGADPNLQMLNVEPARTLIDEKLEQEHLIATLSSFFGLLALFLSAFGLYGVMSYLIARRTSEIGIRMALGASAQGVIRMVLAETLAVVGVGLVAGLLTAMAATRLVVSSLFGLTALDPFTIVVASAVMVLAAAIAGYLPARHAARVDPLVALRYE